MGRLTSMSSIADMWKGMGAQKMKSTAHLGFLEHDRLTLFTPPFITEELSLVYLRIGDKCVYREA